MTSYTLAKNVDRQDIERSLILLDLSNNAYFSLNATGRWFLDALLSAQSQTQILEQAQTRYPKIAPERLAKDFKALLAQLLVLGLLEAKDK